MSALGVMGSVPIEEEAADDVRFLNIHLRNAILATAKAILRICFTILRVRMHILAKVNKTPSKITNKSTSCEHVWNNHNNSVVAFKR